MKLREGKDLFQGLTASEWESQRSGNVANRESLRSPGLRLVFLTTVPYCLRWTFSGLCLIPALPPLLSKLSVMIIPNHLMLPPGKWILELLKNPTFFFLFFKERRGPIRREMLTQSPAIPTQVLAQPSDDPGPSRPFVTTAASRDPNWELIVWAHQP